MEVQFSKRAVRFLKKQDAKTADRIRQKILQLQSMLEVEGVIPFNELDVKKLKGQWEGYFRLRIGQIRVIFTVVAGEIEVLLIYDIDVRGSVYE
ncbi:type II toxin-antitoxin system RelE/ParE family toxin [Leptolyngbya sp. CCNP1308]|uniref:type II toxin-antitoxin system RelE family toxin n=1 Tax=Leptolyngbya sp. CCNP1308 TaxID=3110255 RepID=UPI002B210BDF|nr:type II toxin-antitoxin system RelE/ParE family toxin [Leptolyngbya sp. CCNP1308]MEA5449003.1 type II toxin-antitoxin system RelE/ParE family toxin [Leptolyngbya sp. CCNP1308]